MQRVKLVAGCLATHYDLVGVEVLFILGPRVLEMLQAPRYLNPALDGRC